MAFPERHSRIFLDDLLLNESFNREYKRLNRAKHKLLVATLTCPNIDDAHVQSFPSIGEFDTIIQIELNDKAVPRLLKQIAQDIDSEVLLFLNYLEQISIDINGNISTYTKTSLVQSDKLLIKYEGEGEFSESEWNVHMMPAV